MAVLIGKANDEYIIEQLKTNIDILKKISGNGNTVNSNNTTNHVINNTLITNVHLNHYLNPSLEHIFDIFRDLIVKEKGNISLALIDKIWFDINHPENNSIYLSNYKTKNLVVFDAERWKMMNYKIVSNEINTLTCDISVKELNKVNKISDKHIIHKKLVDNSKHINDNDFLNICALGSKKINKPNLSIEFNSTRFKPIHIAVIKTYKPVSSIIITNYDICDDDLYEFIIKYPKWIACG